MASWRSYSESRVRRGEVILDFDVIDGWHDQLEKMNEGREEGASFRYLHSPLLSGCSGTCARLFPPAVCTDRLKLLSSGRMHGGAKGVPSIPDYSTLCAGASTAGTSGR